MNIKLVLLALVGLTVRSLGDLPIPAHVMEIYEMLGDKPYREQAALLRQLPVEKRERLIAFEKTQWAAGGMAGQYSLKLLFLAGDTWARQELVNQYIDAALVGTSIIHTAGDPEVIPFLIPVLQRSEPFRRFGTDGFTYPPSFNAASAVVDIVSNSPAFNGDTVSWGQRLHQEGGIDPELREVIRDWWRENEQFFREKNYKAVQPGRDPKLILEQAEANRAEALSGLPQSSTISTPDLSRSQTSPSPLLGKAEQPSSSLLGFAITAICATLLGLGLAFVARRSRGVR